MATMKKAKNGLKEPNNPGLKQLPTPVRNKMGFKKNGGTMKSGGKIKKAANGTTTTKTTVKPVLDVKSGMNAAREVINGMQTISSPQKTTKPTRPTTPTTPPPMNNLPPEEAKRRYMRPADTSPERFPTSGVSSNVTAKRGKTIKKAQNGKPIKKANFGALIPLVMKALPMVAGLLGGKKKKMGGTIKKNSKMKIGGMLGGLLGKNGRTVKKSKSGSSIKKAQTGNAIIDKASKDYKSYSAGTGPKPALSSGFKNGGKMKMGGSMKKCKYGCK